MAAIKKIASEWADEIRDGIAWVIIWKVGRSWNAEAVWLNPDTDTFEPGDLELAREILEKDPKAVMVNGYYCGHFGEDMTIAELEAGIRWNYENGYNQLKDSRVFPLETAACQEDKAAGIAEHPCSSDAGIRNLVWLAGCKINEKLARIVGNFLFHSEKAGSDKPLVAEMANRMREVDIWEMWALTQTRDG